MRIPALLTLLCLLAPAASAADAVLAKLKGKVEVMAEGTDDWVRAKEGGHLLYGDSVRVPKGGLAHITLGADKAVLVRERSVFRLGGTAEATELEFDFGEFLIGLRKKLTAKQRFSVRTPAAVAAVRGTLFWGLSDRKDRSTTYAGFGGKVSVEAEGKTVEVTPGKTVVVKKGEPPSDPAPSTVTLEYAGKFMADGTLQGLEALAREKEPEEAPAPKPKRVKKKAPKKDAPLKPEP